MRDCLIVACMTMTAAALPAAEIHISTQGRDDNPGTKSAPVATLQAAQKRVRQQIAGGLKEPVHVIVGGGTYYLDAPLQLTPQDSGTADCPVIWRAAEGEKVLLSGGVRIAGKWQQGERGIWSVDLPSVKEGWNFRQLFVNGTRAIRARFPNARASPGSGFVFGV